MKRIYHLRTCKFCGAKYHSKSKICRVCGKRVGINYNLIIASLLVFIILLLFALVYLDQKEVSQKTAARKSSSFLSNDIIPAIATVQDSILYLENKIYRSEKVKEFKDAVSVLEDTLYQINFDSENLIANNENKIIIRKIKLASLDVIMKGKEVERIVNIEPGYKRNVEPTLIKLSGMTKTENWSRFTSNIGKDLISIFEIINTPES